MAEQGKSCEKCNWWQGGMCRHGMVAEHEHSRDRACPFFAREVSAFAFFVKEWRW
ncbi:MAG TPA: hypothetical protein VL974_08055 [Magnetospirillum sp.]|nr:hypothetical protein [Magnetospirillum sp.]